jgi:hypothetical protein
MGSSPILSLFGSLPISFYDQQCQQEIFFLPSLLLNILCPSNFSLCCVMSRPVLRVYRYVSLASEDIVPKCLELLALQRVPKKISDHVVGSAVFDLRVSLLNLIGYKEVTNV